MVFLNQPNFSKEAKKVIQMNQELLCIKTVNLISLVSILLISITFSLTSRPKLEALTK
jgi:hypothetical protein